MNFPELDFFRTPVTLTITAIALAFELLSTFDPGVRLQLYQDLRLGMVPALWLGEVWRPVTATVLHGGLLHALFNVYWMLIFGVALENYFRPGKFLVIVLAIAFTSSMAQYLFGNPSVGLSGVVYGLFGLIWLGRRFNPDWYYVCPPEVVRILIAWFFICIVLTELRILPIANIAHGVGLAMGVCFAIAIFDRKRRLLGIAGLVLLCGGSVVSLFYAPWHDGYQLVQRVRAQRANLRQQQQQMQQFLIEQHGEGLLPANPPADDHAPATAPDSPPPGGDAPADPATAAPQAPAEPEDR